MDNVIDLEGEEDSYEDEDEKDTDGWVTRIIYEPWAFSGDLPEPDESGARGRSLPTTLTGRSTSSGPTTETLRSM